MSSSEVWCNSGSEHNEEEEPVSLRILSPGCHLIQFRSPQKLNVLVNLPTCVPAFSFTNDQQSTKESPPNTSSCPPFQCFFDGIDLILLDDYSYVPRLNALQTSTTPIIIPDFFLTLPQPAFKTGELNQSLRIVRFGETISIPHTRNCRDYSFTIGSLPTTVAQTRASWLLEISSVHEHWWNIPCVSHPKFLPDNLLSICKDGGLTQRYIIGTSGSVDCAILTRWFPPDSVGGGPESAYSGDLPRGNADDRRDHHQQGYHPLAKLLLSAHSMPGISTVRLNGILRQSCEALFDGIKSTLCRRGSIMILGDESITTFLLLSEAILRQLGSLPAQFQSPLVAFGEKILPALLELDVSMLQANEGNRGALWRRDNPIGPHQYLDLISNHKLILEESVVALIDRINSGSPMVLFLLGDGKVVRKAIEQASHETNHSIHLNVRQSSSELLVENCRESADQTDYLQIAAAFLGNIKLHSTTELEELGDSLSSTTKGGIIADANVESTTVDAPRLIIDLKNGSSSGAVLLGDESASSLALNLNQCSASKSVSYVILDLPSQSSWPESPCYTPYVLFPKPNTSSVLFEQTEVDSTTIPIDLDNKESIVVTDAAVENKLSLVIVGDRTTDVFQNPISMIRSPDSDNDKDDESINSTSSSDASEDGEKESDPSNKIGAEMVKFKDLGKDPLCHRILLDINDIQSAFS